MNPVVKNILAVIVGIVFGSIVNMGIIMISGSVIPPPDGADVTTMEGLKSSMHLFQPKNFIMPFLAHAFGTLAGAFFAALIAANHKMKFALVIGFVFMAGGITNVIILPSPRLRWCRAAATQIGSYSSLIRRGTCRRRLDGP